MEWIREKGCARRVGLLLGVVALTAPSTAFAEGSAGPELDTSQALRQETDIHVDILDFTNETFVWTGRGSVEVVDPMGASVGTFASGATITPVMNGAYVVDLLENQYDSDMSGNIIRSTIVPWDVTVSVGGTPRPGRVFSFVWAFNTGAFAAFASTNASFYAKVPGGDDESFAVIELRTDGLAGFIFEIQGNRTGVRGANAGRSVPELMNSAANEYAMYLNPPDNASYNHLSPTVADFAFRGGLEVGGSVGMCDSFVPGRSMGEFSFTTNVEGSFHLICDLNMDGIFDIVDDGDFLILGTTTPGVNTVPFDGLDNNGMPFSLGNHTCRVRVTVGEFHYVGRDIETSFRGLRMFEVDPSRRRIGAQMYWNDALVQSNAVSMPTPFRYRSASTSGPNGLDSGDPGDATVPLRNPGPAPSNANSRAWGDFVSGGGAGNGKGNEAYLDTYTWLDEALSTDIIIRAVDGTTDTDGEGLPDYTEECITGTNPLDPDSDGDTVNDFIETTMGVPGVDTDGDGTIDALDENDDDDCILTRDEDLDGSGDASNDDTDGDGLPNYLDEDDDNDGIFNCDEDPNGDGDPTNDDTDGDGVPNYLDTDSDGDCALMMMLPSIMCLDGVDGCIVEPETPNDFEDLDGCPEPDRDMDLIPDGLDNCPDIPNGPNEEMAGEGDSQADLDRDRIGDACDDDIDGDGLLNRCEGVDRAAGDTCPTDCWVDGDPEVGCANTDPRDADTDNGGLEDGIEVFRGSDPLDPIDDPLPGRVTGGGVFTCGIARGGGGDGVPVGGALLILLAACLFRTRDRKGR